MKRINPSAVVLWVLAALIGFLVNGPRGAAYGAAGTITVSMLLSLLP